jgi:hypothetical protein
MPRSMASINVRRRSSEAVQPGACVIAGDDIVDEGKKNRITIGQVEHGGPSMYLPLR